MKFGSTDTMLFSGASSFIESVSVTNNWNMIGSITSEVNTESITTDGISVQSSYFGFSNSTGYTSATTLEPGKAYWVKTSGNGRLILTAASVPAFEKTRLSSDEKKGATISITSNTFENELTTIVVRDAGGRERRLFISTNDVERGATLNELPPPPPAGLFDVRFTSQKLVESFNDESAAWDYPIVVNNARYPLTVQVINAREKRSYSLRYSDEKNTKRKIGLTEGKVATVESEMMNIALVISGGVVEQLPTEFQLQQNYPNPFNPLTIISYDLPVSSYVTLKVYDLLGREVATLVDGIQYAGFKRQEWDATNYPSGMYFYKLEAGNFSQTKRLVLVK
ncbi:MAG: T9SS type A sorting domain-containing protein [Bacteroidetes bacterium]|nr:MAG: T9SS type A sorting domain-containing protein [Bacteroidota bacterium]